MKIKKSETLENLAILGILTIAMAPFLHSQVLPAGTARIYGFGMYLLGDGRTAYIRHANVELWEDSFFDTLLAISETDEYGYYEFNIALSGSKNVYAKIYCESYIAYVTYGVFDSIYYYKTKSRKEWEEGTT